MNESEMRVPSVNGHLIVLGTGHSIAIYERNGEGYVVEFRDGRAELMHAGTWFRFHAEALRGHNPHTALEISMRSTPEIAQKIERLHAESEARRARMRAMVGNVAAMVKRCLLWVTSRPVG